MFFRQLIPLLVMTTFVCNVKADSLAYVVSAGITGDGIFGTVDLNTGAFQQVGPGEPDGYFGLTQGPNGSLAALTYAGNLVSINPATGVPAQIGATGLGACVIPTPACGPTSAFSLGGLNGTIYATDYANGIFAINPSTGAATLLAQNSGIPASPFVPGSQNANGTLDFADEAIWQSGGKLFATYDAWIFDPTSSSVASIAVAPELYEIDPTTGLATAVGPTALGIGGVVDVNGTNYAIDDITNQILSLDLADGSTSVVGVLDSSAGVVQGASPVPEPASFVLLGVALLGLAAYRRRWLSCLRLILRMATVSPTDSRLTEIAKLFACMSFLALVAPAFAGNPFDGTWRTNRALSRPSTKPLTFTLTNGIYLCSTCLPKTEVKADGTDQPCTLFGMDTLNVRTVNDKTIALIGKKGGRPVYELTRTVSDDGQTETRKEMIHTENGQTVTNEATYTRVGKVPEGAHPASGSWRIDKETSSESDLLTTFKFSGDQLTMSTPDGEGFTAKIDGKDYPVKGSAWYNAVSLRRVNDNTIEEKDKRDGKVVGTSRRIVSPDGKKMTVVVTTTEIVETSTYVAEKQ